MRRTFLTILLLESTNVDEASIAAMAMSYVGHDCVFIQFWPGTCI
jgi:hypothetical protein